jgi:hypothetical protein
VIQVSEIGLVLDIVGERNLIDTIFCYLGGKARYAEVKCNTILYFDLVYFPFLCAYKMLFCSTYLYFFDLSCFGGKARSARWVEAPRSREAPGC